MACNFVITHECVRTLYVLVTLFVAGRRRDTRRHPSQEEEPEWFTGGPSSQSDTIELIGFEVAEEQQRAKREAAERKALADSRNSTLYVTLPLVQAFYGQKLVNLPQIATEANSTDMMY